VCASTWLGLDVESPLDGSSALAHIHEAQAEVMILNLF
jgi:hypothetical protein